MGHVLVHKCTCNTLHLLATFNLTLLHSEWPKLYGVLTILSAVGCKKVNPPVESIFDSETLLQHFLATVGWEVYLHTYYPYMINPIALRTIKTP